MPGDKWQRFANLRTLFAYMWAHPGKMLMFMGGEIAQEREWDFTQSLDWHLLEDGGHAGMQSLVRDLNRVYRGAPALWEVDFEPAGFWWLEANAAADNVVAFARASQDAEEVLVCVANLAPVPREGYRLGLPRSGAWTEALNTDSEFYGGTNTGNLGAIEAKPLPYNDQPFSAQITLPPLSVLWLVPQAPPAA